MIFRLGFLILFCVEAFAQSYWPTQSWRTSTPEEQGIDSNKLAEAVEFILRENMQAHSLLVVRNGFIVADAYFYPFTPNTRHDVASVTKSITSSLIGIAIDKGLIKGVSRPVFGLFADRKAANQDERKRAMVVEHLLMMESGLQCVNSPTEVTLSQMMESPDWIQFQLDLPMIESPGKRFTYNSGAVHLLSAMVRKTSGMSALSFARKHLFEPLGISDVIWPTDPRGEDNHGWGDLQLRPQDMAKIGYLFMQNGRWEGKPILSADWVRSATQKRVSLEDGEGYGYLWWMPAQPSGLVEARGRGGQRIIIWLEKNAVIVFTGGGFEPGRVGSYLVTALESDKPLAANPAGTSRLEKIIKRVAEPSAASKSDAVYWPETAKAISGKRYALEPNSRLIQALTLTYKNEKEAVLRLLPDPSASDTRQIEFLIGLDDVSRLAPGRFGLAVACKGAWISPETFVIEIDEVANINQFRLELTFENSRLDGKLAEMTGLGSIPIHGKLE